MCLMPGGGGYLCPPTEKAAKFGKYFKIVMVIHLFVAILQVVDGEFQDSLFCLIGACTGYMAIRNPEGYSIQQMLCYIFLIGLQNIFKFVWLVMWAAGVDATTMKPDWRTPVIHPMALIVSCLLYTVGVGFAYVIYEELRRFINEGHDITQGGGSFPGGGQAAGGSQWAQPESHPGQNPYADNSSEPAANTTGFTPFSGKGYTLV